MQPNFAFEPSSPLEMIPQSRTAEHLSTTSPSQRRKSLESSSTDASPQSFRSNLREASRRQEDNCRSKVVDDVQRPDRGGRSERIEPQEVQAPPDDAPDTGSDQSVDNTDSGSPERTTQDLTGPGESEEAVDNELAGIGAVTMAGTLAETADQNLATDLNTGTVSPVGAGNETQPAVTPGDQFAGGSGIDSPDQRGSLAGQSDGFIKSDPHLKIDGPHTEMMASVEKEPLTSLKSAEGTEPGTAEAIKGLNEWVKTDSPATSTAQANGEAHQGLGAASDLKNTAPDRSPIPAQPIDPTQAEQSAAGLKPRMTQAVQTDDASGARSSEASGEQPNAGRMQSDLMQGREGEVKNEAITADEVAPKVAKMNPGGKDSAFMQYQDQNFERLMEPATATREKETSPGLLRTQTIDQIVSKAVYQIKDGQNSVRIDLKPEFLGQVRMQIVTVDQQVSIRIAAELPVVKEMLENNLQQLKADLQQQGLEVDEIEVSVSTDSRHSAQNQKMESDSKSQQKTSAEDDDESGAVPAPQTASRSRTSNLAVDMFV